MAEPRLTLVEKVFNSLPEPADETEARKRKGERGIVARYIPSICKEYRPSVLEEGRQDALKKLGVQRIEEASMIADMKKQYAEQLSATERLHGRGSAWRAAFFGIVAGVVLGGGSSFYMLQQGWYAQVAAQRVPRAGVPSIQYEAPELAYDRDRREPGDAP